MFLLQVGLLRDNAESFSRICFLKLMFDSILEREFDYDDLTNVYLGLFLDSKQHEKHISKDSELFSSTKRTIAQVRFLCLCNYIISLYLKISYNNTTLRY